MLQMYGCVSLREINGQGTGKMSCYFRHIKAIIAEAGIEVTPQNKKQVDKAIHQIMGIDYKDCPATWKTMKQHLAGEPARQDFINNLRHAARP